MQNENIPKVKSVDEMDNELDAMLHAGEIEVPEGQGFVFDPANRRGRPRIGEKMKITAPEELIALLKKAGERRGVGYQTMARIILKEKIDEYLK